MKKLTTIVSLTGLAFITSALITSAVARDQAQVRLSEDLPLMHDLQTSLICKAELPSSAGHKLKKEVVMIGQVRHTRASPQSREPGIVQIVWTGVQAKDRKRRKAYFRQPLISTFKAPSSTLAKGTSIEMVGDLQQIAQTVETLDNTDALQEARGLEQNPAVNERRVEDSATRRQKGYGSGLLNEDQQGRPQGDGHSGHGTRGHPSELQNGSNARSADRTGHPHSSPVNDGLSYGKGASRGSRFNQGGSFAAPNPYSSPPSPSSSTTPAAQPAPSSPQKGSSDKTGHGQQENYQGRDPFEVRQDRPAAETPKSEQELRTEITDKGCQPRIDLVKGQYIIQTKSIIYQGDKIIEESACGDSHIWYPLKKDYRVCKDEVDPVKRVAYTTFQWYWPDPEGNRHYLDARCIKDESQPHPFIEDTRACDHHVDLAQSRAWRQAETIYYDRSNARRRVKACHKVGEVLPITLTSNRCKPRHLFEKKHSIIQKRAVFNDQGVEHEVLPCHDSPETVPHAFVKADCKALVMNHTVTPMVKRQITLKGKKCLITKDCEPLENTTLHKTAQGCEGQLEHDFEAGRSYHKIRWFYEFRGKSKFVTSCMRSDHFYLHLVKFKDYKHEDDKLRSIPLVEISIATESGPLVIRDQLETDEKRFIPYIRLKKGVKHQPYPNIGGETMEGILACAQMIKMVPLRYVTLWRRADGTGYEQLGAVVQDKGIMRQYQAYLGVEGWALYYKLVAEPTGMMELP